MVRALSELEFNSVQLNRKDAVKTLQAVECGFHATASGQRRAQGKLE